MRRRTLSGRARTATGRVAALAACALAVTTLFFVDASPASAAFPTTSAPQLQLDHVLQTSPFVGSSVSMQDDEGSAYVARDNSLWLADDNAKKLYEVDPTTGALKRTIGRKTFEAVKQYGGGTTAGSNRDVDLESLAYDSVNDTLYAFSGLCCTSTVLPTVFRLTRGRSGKLQPDSYQPLATGSDFTAAAWNPADGSLYVGAGSTLQTYDYPTNTTGQTFGVTNLTGIHGLAFSADGADLYVARRPAQLSRVDWATKTLVPGWTFDLTPFGLLDTRAVEVFNDQFWVSDGYDSRPAGDPLSHAVFVLDVVAPTAPAASFTSSASSGDAPLSVTFTDTSTGAPTSWAWDFGDGGSATVQNPSHTYISAGTYTVTLTATNGSGSGSATGTITVTSPPPSAPTASFTATPTSGTAPLSVSFTDTSAGVPTSWAWDFGDGGSAAVQNPSYSYSSAGTYTVTLTATNDTGSDTASTVITVSSAPPPQNLVGNPGFEVDTTGWSGPLARVAGGHTGSWAAQLTNSGTTAATIALTDHPNWVATTSAGTYTASVWVRADVAGATAYLKLREYQAGTKVGETSTRVVLSTTWQQLTVTMVPVAPGSSTIDFTNYVYNAAAGSSFYADDVGIRLS